MAKTKKTKPSPKTAKTKAPPSASARALRRRVINGCFLAITLGVLAFGFLQLRSYVDKRLVFPSQRPRIVLKNQPAWMSPALVDRITTAARPNGTHSAFDQQVLKDIVDTLSKDAEISPWIAKVNQVRRIYDGGPAEAIEVDCEFRAPIALVHWGDYYWLVDGNGVKLPEEFKGSQLSQIMFDAQGRTNVRIIDGVSHPPPISGQKWAGDDLAAGLDLVKLLYGKPYAQEIVTVNVDNFDARRNRSDPQLVLITRHGTRVLWGRPINAKDFFVESPPQSKLAALQSIVKKYGRVDANCSWIDVRIDDVLFPRDEVPASAPVEAKTD